YSSIPNKSGFFVQSSSPLDSALFFVLAAFILNVIVVLCDKLLPAYLLHTYFILNCQIRVGFALNTKLGQKR
ncbi:unnamed protein product, partial [Heligmosomoides polygyrus]|uniref:7TM_GPCR_Srx domain-containing protein n=1 Tax=Heligmosomoides polygyrus TaxID=6339 RepID=A0A183GLG1_HELPZ